jgi:putative oxidoreductase
MPPEQSGTEPQGETMVSKSRLYIPALGQTYESLAPYAELLLRAGLGAILVVHGLQKFFGWFGGAGIERTAQLLEKFGYPAPIFLTYLIASLEAFGGALLVVGLFVRPVAFAMVVFMLFAVHYTSVNSGFIWFRGGSEYSLAILFISFYYLVNGAGPLSLDHKRGREF